MYHFFQLPAAAPLAAVDAAGAQFCGLTWAEVDRTRGLEKQARLQRICSYALYPIPYALNPPVTVGLAALLRGGRRLPPSPKARKTIVCIVLYPVLYTLYPEHQDLKFSPLLTPLQAHFRHIL